MTCHQLGSDLKIQLSLRNKYHTAAAAHNLLVDLLSDSLGVVPGKQESRRVVDALGQASAYPARTNTDSPYFGGIVAHVQLGSQPFMQGDGRGLGARIRNYVWGRSASGYRRDGDDGAMVAVNHCRDKLSDQAEMGDDIDLEDLGDGILGGIEKRKTGARSCIID
ncbi:MAG: hypothetical protein Q9221_002503 [Calogaya cf. arnoldii]